MSWNTIASLKGPAGEQGPRGEQGIQGVAGVAGEPGVDGRSVSIVASVPNVDALPTGLGQSDAGKGWITQNDGHLHVWSGNAFTDVGEIKGPRGDKGDAGASGAVGPEGAQGVQGPAGPAGAQGNRGTAWFTGTGAPGAVSGAQPGDMYLDTATGTVYRLD